MFQVFHSVNASVSENISDQLSEIITTLKPVIGGEKFTSVPPKAGENEVDFDFESENDENEPVDEVKIKSYFRGGSLCYEIPLKSAHNVKFDHLVYKKNICDQSSFEVFLNDWDILNLGIDLIYIETIERPNKNRNRVYFTFRVYVPDMFNRKFKLQKVAFKGNCGEIYIKAYYFGGDKVIIAGPSNLQIWR